MRLDDLRESENIEDRRGQGGGMGGGFGGRGLAIGGGGLGVVIAVVYVLLGGNLSDLTGTDGGAPPQQATAPGAPRADDALLHFSSKIVASTEDVWSAEFSQRGERYRPPIFVPYEGATETACGMGQSAMGPFYCPRDRKVYVDLGFYRELRERFGAGGDFAQAYVIAHEIGHHVQNLLGQSEMAEENAARFGGREGAGGSSVRLELQADCYAGVWANRADASKHILEQGDVAEGLAAANAVGDDTLQRAARGRVAPDTFTHGTSAQRVRWFKRGLETGRLEACDTFSASRL